MASKCGKCGQIHVCASLPGVPCCKGHLSSNKPNGRRKGDPCSRPALSGQRVCQYHGGATQAAKAAAEQRKAAEESHRQLTKLANSLGEQSDVTDPSEIVLEQIQWRHGHVRWLRTRAMAIAPKQAVWGRTKKKVGGDDHGVTSEAKPNIWWQLYFQASGELEKLCIEAIRAGLEERRVKLAEQQADALVGMLDGLLIDLGRDPNDPQTAETVERHLRALSA